jgi:hypothetical protein
MIATEAIRERTIEYLSRNGAMRIALFGSYVNGEEPYSIGELGKGALRAGGHQSRSSNREFHQPAPD